MRLAGGIATTIAFIACTAAHAQSTFTATWDQLPKTHYVPGYQVVVREPAEDVRARTGPEGPMVEFEVRDLARKNATVFHAPSLKAEVVASRSGPPHLDLWSKLGAGEYTKCRFRFEKSRYCLAECEDHRDGEQGLAKIARPARAYACDSPQVRR
jgi:hypothetical protein